MAAVTVPVGSTVGTRVVGVMKVTTTVTAAMMVAATAAVTGAAGCTVGTEVVEVMKVTSVIALATAVA